MVILKAISIFHASKSSKPWGNDWQQLVMVASNKYSSLNAILSHYSTVCNCNYNYSVLQTSCISVVQLIWWFCMSCYDLLCQKFVVVAIAIDNWVWICWKNHSSRPQGNGWQHSVMVSSSSTIQCRSGTDSTCTAIMWHYSTVCNCHLFSLSDTVFQFSICVVQLVTSR